MAMTLQEQLDDAKRAFHELLTGSLARVVVDQNGERVEFTNANRGALAQYIQQLEAQISGKRVNHPARAFFA